MTRARYRPYLSLWLLISIALISSLSACTSQPVTSEPPSLPPVALDDLLLQSSDFGADWTRTKPFDDFELRGAAQEGLFVNFQSPKPETYIASQSVYYYETVGSAYTAFKPLVSQDAGFGYQEREINEVDQWVHFAWQAQAYCSDVFLELGKPETIPFCAAELHYGRYIITVTSYIDGTYIQFGDFRSLLETVNQKMHFVDKPS